MSTKGELNRVKKKEQLSKWANVFQSVLDSGFRNADEIEVILDWLNTDDNSIHFDCLDLSSAKSLCDSIEQLECIRRMMMVKRSKA